MEHEDHLKAALADRYAIEREIGCGGMATVYLAQDLKHDRKVAVKVLRPELAAVVGTERFLAEIRTTANLSHPHILPLFDSGEADGFLFYVMPFVEGETLRDRLSREKQLPVAEAVRIATEVANALDYAHRQDVIHRDIKPGNILLQDGQALVADFGIALAVTVAGGSRVTETGLSLGTPEYMSPEQATADQELDTRSDIYSLGAVLYEMLSGEPPHTGSSVQAIISRVLTGTVEPVSRGRPSVPEHVDAAVLVALERLAADRFQSAQEFAGALTGEHPVEAPSVLRARRGPPSVASAWRAVRNQASALALFLLLSGVGIGWLIFGPGTHGRPGATITRYTIPHPPGSGLDFAISPDGNNLVMQKEGMLHIRPLDQFESRPLPGTEGGVDPFFSPDGVWVGFVQDWVLKKVPVLGGPVQEITDLPLGWLFGAHWAESGDIVYSWVGGVRRVPAAGGEPEVLTQLDTLAEHAHYWPQLLDEGRLLLFTAGGPSGLWEDHSVVLLDRETGLRQVIAEEAGSGWYVDTGHILYSLRDGTLFALPFDLERRQATGEPFAVESEIYTSQRGSAGFRVSKSGTAAFFRGSAWEASRLVTVNRNGEAREFGDPLVAYHFRYSSRGDQVAVSIIDADNADLFLLDPASDGDLDRLTFDPIYDETPAWSADGSRMAYSSEWYGGVSRVHVKPVDPAAPAQELFTGTSHIHLGSWSPDGQWLAFSQYEPFRRQDLLVVDVDSVENVITMVATPADEVGGYFSPDGRWLAYATDESGTPEVFVMPFPPTGGKRQISVGGGGAPRWAAETNELFYWHGDTLMVSRVSTGDQFLRETPRPLFVFPGRIGNYNVSPDGQQFIGKVPNPAGQPQKIHVVLNWMEVLRNTGR